MIDLENILDEWSNEQLAVLKHRLETNFLEHAKFFLAYREKHPFILSPHHMIIANTLNRVISGEIKRLIINMPPGYTKTELAVIQFVAFCLAANPKCRFMHVSGNETLVMFNSMQIKTQIENDISKRFWGLSMRPDANSKGLWLLNKGGSFYAVSAGGQIIGFRAGRMEPGFQGALIIDDPQKEEDMWSPVKVKKFPDRYKGVIRHRTATRETPIIVIMQRLGDEDFSGFLLEGGSGELWYHLCLPSIIP